MKIVYRFIDWLDLVQSKFFGLFASLINFAEASWYNCILSFIPLFLATFILTLFLVFFCAISFVITVVLSFLSDFLRYTDESEKNN